MNIKIFFTIIGIVIGILTNVVVGDPVNVIVGDPVNVTVGDPVNVIVYPELTLISLPLTVDDKNINIIITNSNILTLYPLSLV